MTGLLALGLASTPACGAPFTPAGDDQVLERLPLGASDPRRRELAPLRERHARDPANPALAAERTAVLDPQAEPTVFEVVRRDRFADFGRYLVHGAWQFWLGFGRLLFLLSLLLPSVLVWRSRPEPGWRPATRVAPVSWDVLRIVAAFTVAHSITLACATLGWVQWPARTVEAAIAASVVLVAPNIVVPLLHGRRWMMAFGVGLVHGLGLAGALAQLGLPPGMRAPAWLGFDMGIQLGQGATVAVWVPLAYPMRHRELSRRLVLVGGHARSRRWRRSGSSSGRSMLRCWDADAETAEHGPMAIRHRIGTKPAPSRHNRPPQPGRSTAMTPFASPRLLADVGGTYARFTLEVAPRVFRHGTRLRCAEHASLFDAVQAYLRGLPADGSERIEHAAIGIANPVDGDQVRMTNHHWQFSIEQLRKRLGLETLVVVNDFTALAMALPQLAREERRQVGGGAPRAASALGLLGAGTGLGVSGLIPAAGGWVALAGEGGHVAMAARDERELVILSHARRQFTHVSFERVLSGPGIELIYRALAEAAGQAGASLPASEITRRALDGSESLCVETVDAFCALLGTAASNLALTLGALGGIYIGGGIVPRLGEHFDRSPFRARFEDKGRFTDYMRAIPTYVVTAEHAAFVGVSALLARH